MRTSPTSSLERKEAALCSKYFAPHLLVGRRKERWGFAVLSTKAPSQQLFPCMMWVHSKCWWLLKKDCHPQGDHRWPPGRCPPHDQLNARQILYQFWARWHSFGFSKGFFLKWSQGSPHEKKNVFFWALPEKGGGRPLPEFFDPFSDHVTVPYILLFKVSLFNKMTIRNGNSAKTNISFPTNYFPKNGCGVEVG